MDAPSRLVHHHPSCKAFNGHHSITCACLENSHLGVEQGRDRSIKQLSCSMQNYSTASMSCLLTLRAVTVNRARRLLGGVNLADGQVGGRIVVDL